MASRKNSRPSVASEGSAGSRESGLKTRLSVASFTKRPRRTSEKNFEKKFYEALAKAGHPNWHMACREAGWPDRYAVGGLWFELKSLHTLADESQLSTDQVRKLKELDRAGDKCYYVAKYDSGVIFVPWHAFKTHLSPARAAEQGHRYSYKNEADLMEMIRYVVH